MSVYDFKKIVLICGHWGRVDRRRVFLLDNGRSDI